MRLLKILNEDVTSTGRFMTEREARAARKQRVKCSQRCLLKKEDDGSIRLYLPKYGKGSSVEPADRYRLTGVQFEVKPA